MRKLYTSLALALSVALSTTTSSADTLDELTARAAADSPDAAGALPHWLNGVNWLPMHEQLERATELAATASDPAVRMWAHIFSLETLRALAPSAEGAAALNESGVILDWALLGPFPNDGMAGFNSRLEIELEGTQRGEWPGRGYQLTWMTVPKPHTELWLRPGTFLGPDTGSVYYLAATITADTATEAWLQIGASGAQWAAWLDGKPLARRSDDWGGPPFRDRVEVTMTGQPQLLVIKIGSADRPPRVSARLADLQGQPLSFDRQPADSWELELEAPEDQWPLPDTLVSFEPPEGGCAAVEGASRALLLSWAAPRAPSEPWRPWVRCALEALEAGDVSAQDRLWALWYLGGAAQASWQREELLRQAVELASPDGLVALSLATSLRGRLDLDAKVEMSELISAALEASDEPNIAWRIARGRVLQDSLAGQAALHSLLDGLDFDALSDRALGEIEELAAALHREDLIAPIRIARLQQAKHSPLRWLNALIAHRPGDGELDLEPEWQLRLAEAQDHPYWSASAGDLAFLRSDYARAAELYGRAVELSRGIAVYYDALSRAYLALGDEVGAAAALEQLLLVAPQNQGSRDLLQRLQRTTDDFFAQWRADVPALLAGELEPLDAEAELEWLVDNKVTQVHHNGLASAWHQRALRVMSRAGADRLRSISISYTPDAQRVEVLGVRIHRADGSLRDRFSSQDYSLNQGPASIYYDVQQRQIILDRLEPGDTVEWEFVLSDVAFRNIFDDYYGDLRFIQDDSPKRAFRHAVIMPEGRELSLNDPGLEGASWQVEELEGHTLYSFEAYDIARLRYEPNAPGPSEHGAFVHVSTYSSWDSLADWYWNLVRDQFAMSPELRALVASLVEGADSDLERASRIYEWVVDNIRYVSLSFGIHGFRPYRTTECLTRRFGDCKDTATLLKVMLEEAGIDTDLVLIRTRDLGRVEAFPPSLALFNHAIVYVPSLDLWLDGTAAHFHASETPWVDQAASVLIVNEGRGGTFRESGTLDADKSLIETVVEVDLRGEVARGELSWVVRGHFAATMRREWANLERRRERAERSLQRVAAGVEVDSMAVRGVEPRELESAAVLELRGGSWGRRQDNQWRALPLQVPPTLLERYAPSATRTLPLQMESAAVLVERISWRLPPGSLLVSSPEPLKIELPQARIDFNVEFDEASATVDVTLRLELLELRVELEDYPAWRQAFVDVERRLQRELIVDLPSERMTEEVSR